MKEKTILIIDDSATIRRFVDNELTSAGYRVIAASHAEEGIELAKKEQPDLILLDHQLPGTTGFDVCCELLKDAETASIPVVASSTLRKKAYAEYLDCENVVDMLPKPYKPEVLVATVENSLETAAMVVQSQSDGSAVPEVIDEVGDADLAGTFGMFSPREIIDLLNNGTKTGALEMHAGHVRIHVFVDRGRIQAVTGSGISHEEFTSKLPETLAELAPVMKFTLSGRKGAEVDGLVDLLDNKVLDPRLLKKLLRVQAAMLLNRFFQEPLDSFRFEQREMPSIYKKLPLDCSLVALMVEGALHQEFSPVIGPKIGFVKCSNRGQNMDRAGLSAKYLKLMSHMSEPRSVDQLVEKLGWKPDEILRVLAGFEMAGHLTRQELKQVTNVAVISQSDALVRRLGEFFSEYSDQISGKLLREWNSAPAMLDRYKPDVLLIDIRDEQAIAELESLQKKFDGKTVGILSAAMLESSMPESLVHEIVSEDFSSDSLLESLLASSGELVEGVR